MYLLRKSVRMYCRKTFYMHVTTKLHAEMTLDRQHATASAKIPKHQTAQLPGASLKLHW